MFMSASLKHLFLETATIRSRDKHTTVFLTSGAEILIFLYPDEGICNTETCRSFNKKST